MAPNSNLPDVPASNHSPQLRLRFAAKVILWPFFVATAVLSMLSSAYLIVLILPWWSHVQSDAIDLFVAFPALTLLVLVPYLTGTVLYSLTRTQSARRAIQLSVRIFAVLSAIVLAVVVFFLSARF
jgi:hypothetical protein